MELRENGRDFCALTQKLPSIALQRGEEIVNCSIDVSTKLTAIALDVLRVWSIDADMHTFPSAMAALWTPGTTLMGTQMFASFVGCHGVISLSRRDAMPEYRQESGRFSL
jgi:hypothetical protein